MRILVLDDDVVVSMSLSMALEDDEVVDVTRGRELLPAARRHRPDVVVADERLPDGSGLDAVRELRNDAELGGVVIVVLTASHDPARRGEVLGAGADEYVGKPFEPEALAALLRRLAAVPAEERRIRRTLHRARLHAGRDDGGLDDIPELAPPPLEPKRRRFRRG